MSEFVEVKKAIYGQPAGEFKNQAEIESYFRKGGDFQMFSTGQYVNRPDAEKYGLVLGIRYGKNFEKIYVPKEYR